MKCEKCNQKEASVYYRATVNGETSEQHLCADCAGELGLDKAFSWQSRDLFEEAFGGFFGRDPFDSFFGGSRLTSFARRAMTPTRILPRIEIGLVEPKAEAPAETKAEAPPETKADPALERRREINALREQLNTAVKAEDYETAIRLRDKLRELEK